MMATQTIEFRSPPTQTTTAKLFAVGSDTQVASVTATEATNRKGTYAAAYTDVAAGEYELIAFVGAVPVARWFVTLTLTTATFQVYDKAKIELIAANAINASAFATDAVTEIQSGIATQASVDTIQSDTNDIQTRLPAALESGRIAAALDSATAAKIDDILTDTGTTLPAQVTALNNLSSAQVVSALGTGTWATAIPWNAAWDAEIQSEVQDAIEVNNLDHLLKIAVDTNFATTVHLDSVVGHMADNGTTATFVRMTDSLEAIRDNQSSGGGGGDATLAKQAEILAAVAGVTSSVASHAARLALEVQIQGFPAVICRNADYVTETESEIRLTLQDLTGTAITEIAGTPVASLAWLFGMGTEAAPAIIAGAVTYDAGTSELVIQFARSVTAAKPLGSITWQIGVSTGSGATLKNRWLGGGTTRLIERQF
jgi:hypothetical protein